MRGCDGCPLGRRLCPVQWHGQSAGHLPAALPAVQPVLRGRLDPGLDGHLLRPGCEEDAGPSGWTGAFRSEEDRSGHARGRLRLPGDDPRFPRTGLPGRARRYRISGPGRSDLADGHVPDPDLRRAAAQPDGYFLRVQGCAAALQGPDDGSVVRLHSRG